MKFLAIAKSLCSHIHKEQKKFVYTTLVTLRFRVTNVSAVLEAEQTQ